VVDFPEHVSFSASADQGAPPAGAGILRCLLPGLRRPPVGRGCIRALRGADRRVPDLIRACPMTHQERTPSAALLQVFV
jgi:hypothetical protein